MPDRISIPKLLSRSLLDQTGLGVPNEAFGDNERGNLNSPAIYLLRETAE